MIGIYTLEEDEWEKIITITDDGDIKTHTEYAEEEVLQMVEDYALPEEEDLLLRHFRGPYLRAERISE